ncbi:MAG: hypothetical protein HY888_04525 [Deltaproteobacteria bacterium]|nr:hypothetical protein [Deltaproteobacteria bacterium]
MPHDTGKEIQEASLIGRILSMEALLLTMGVASLVYGLVNGVAASIVLGSVIVLAIVILDRVRRKKDGRRLNETELQQKANDQRKDSSGPDALGDKR